MILLGFDIGSSSVKASLVEAESGQCIASAFYPKQEAPIISHQAGWAEQDPAKWWEYAQAAFKEAVSKLPSDKGLSTNSKLSSDKGLSTNDIAAIGISYQMHGLVCVDKDQRVLRPAIIWCDSRAVPYGEEAYSALGADFCREHYLNSPGNFTAAKLAWVKANEPELYSRIDKIMLPGDFIAMRLTGEAVTTMSGLSEGILWDFKEGTPAYALLEHYGINPSLLCDTKPTFGIQGTVSKEAAELLGIPAGIPVSYRAGDQPNNALSLGVLHGGEIASLSEVMADYYDHATAGDIIKAKKHFAYFSADKRWVGDLTALTPGEGYLFRRMGQGSVTVNFYDKNAKAPKRVVAAEATNTGSEFTNPSAATNMTMIAQLNSEAINAQGNKRGAIKVYVGDELAAIAEPIDSLYFITIQSDKSGALRFETEDGQTLTIVNNEQLDNQSSIVNRPIVNYVPDAHAGSLKAPVMLRMDEHRPYKIIENNHVIIIKNGEKYDIVGKKLK